MKVVFDTKRFVNATGCIYFSLLSVVCISGVAQYGKVNLRQLLLIPLASTAACASGFSVYAFILADRTPQPPKSLLEDDE